MKRLSTLSQPDDAPVQVELTRDELLIISNALNEIANGVPLDDDDLLTRLGASRKAIRQLLKSFEQFFE